MTDLCKDKILTQFRGGCDIEAQNYHKISKMQSNHNGCSINESLYLRKITTKFQKCNQITTQRRVARRNHARKITTKFQKCNQITTDFFMNPRRSCAKLPQNFKNAIKSQRLRQDTICRSSAKLPQNFKNAIKSQQRP